MVWFRMLNTSALLIHFHSGLLMEVHYSGAAITISFDVRYYPWFMYKEDALSWYSVSIEAPEAAPQSPDQAPLSPAHALVYLEFLAPSDDDLETAEAQPLPAFDPEEDPEEDPKEDLEKEPSGEEEEELSTSADSPPAGLYIDLPSEVEEDEVHSTPPSPTSHHHIIPLSQTGLRRAQMSIQPQTPLPPSIDALIEEWHTAPPSPSPSPLSTLSSPLPRIPSPPLLL
ncbi:hypothetical protein Tco_0205315 [Tanacetum coccineum]